MSTADTAQVFLSYGRKSDLVRARRLYASLVREGIDVWFDEKSIKPGAEWKNEINKAIPKSQFFLFCMSSESVRRAKTGEGFLEEELQHAYMLANKQDKREFQLIPVRFEECFSRDNRLSDKQWVDLFPDWNVGISLLVKHIKGFSSDFIEGRDHANQIEEFILNLKTWVDVAYLANDHFTAYEAIDTIIKYKSHAADSCYYKSLAMLVAGFYREALDAIHQALNLYPESDLWTERGYCLHVLGLGPQAWKSIEIALLIDKNNFRAWHNKGAMLGEKGKYEEELECYNKALSINPHLSKTWQNKAFVLERFGRYREAEQAYKLALDFAFEQ